MEIWKTGGVLVIRDCLFVWDDKLDPDVLLSGREDVEYTRRPKGPWQTGAKTPEVRRELMRLYCGLQELFYWLYSDLGPPTYSQFTYRPTITRGIPHHDVEKGTVITCFINLDDEDRLWRIEGEDVAFPPRSLWIFQAEKTEHQVVYGRCAAQMNWHLMP